MESISSMDACGSATTSGLVELACDDDTGPSRAERSSEPCRCSGGASVPRAESEACFISGGGRVGDVEPASTIIGATASALAALLMPDAWASLLLLVAGGATTVKKPLLLGASSAPLVMCMCAPGTRDELRLRGESTFDPARDERM